MSNAQLNPIRAARAAKGLTQGELGGKLGVSKATVCGYEADRYIPGPAKIMRLVRALKGGVTVEQIVRHYANVEEREAA